MYVAVPWTLRFPPTRTVPPEAFNVRFPEVVVIVFALVPKRRPLIRAEPVPNPN